MRLQPLDPSNTDHLARQLVLVARFGEFLASQPDPLQPDTSHTLSQQLLFVLETHCSELSRLLDGKPMDALHRMRMEEAAAIAVSLIDRLITQKPELRNYSPNVLPTSFDQVMLNQLAHAVLMLTPEQVPAS